MCELYHHGILGMKWGVRKKRPVVLDSKDDAKAARLYGERSAKRIKNRIVNKGMSRSKATNRESARSIALAPVKGIAAATAGLGLAYMTDPSVRVAVNKMAISAIRNHRARNKGNEFVNNVLGISDYVADPSEYIVHFGIKGMKL